MAQPRRHRTTHPGWQTGGIVEDVDPKHATITLWIQGFDVTTVPIDPVMPGWLFKRGRCFTVWFPQQWSHAGILSPPGWIAFAPQGYADYQGDKAFWGFNASLYPKLQMLTRKRKICIATARIVHSYRAYRVPEARYERHANHVHGFFCPR